MSGYKGFEEIRVWQDARALVQHLDAASRQDRAPERTAGVVMDELVADAIRISALIAEGHQRGDRDELQEGLRRAMGAAAAVRARLYHAQDLGVLAEDCVGELQERTRFISAQLGAWLRTMRGGGGRHDERPPRAAEGPSPDGGDGGPRGRGTGAPSPGARPAQRRCA